MLPTTSRISLDTLFDTLDQRAVAARDRDQQDRRRARPARAPGLKTLTDELAKVVAIGVNVESGPGKAADNTKYKFNSALAATPDQATPVVTDQTLVRAIEIDLLGGQVAGLALGNAAAGPSTPAVTPPTSSTPSADDDRARHGDPDRRAGRSGADRRNADAADRAARARPAHGSRRRRDLATARGRHLG